MFKTLIQSSWKIRKWSLRLLMQAFRTTQVKGFKRPMKVKISQKRILLKVRNCQDHLGVPSLDKLRQC